MIQIKRAYEPAKKSDGYRVLVDRLWPRGRKKEQLALDEWAKVLAPSPGLRKFFAHEPKRWEVFQSRYCRELHANVEAIEKLNALTQLARKKTVTLVYGAHDETYNHAAALKKIILSQK